MYPVAAAHDPRASASQERRNRRQSHEGTGRNNVAVESVFNTDGAPLETYLAPGGNKIEHTPCSTRLNEERMGATVPNQGVCPEEMFLVAVMCAEAERKMVYTSKRETSLLEQFIIIHNYGPHIIHTSNGE